MTDDKFAILISTYPDDNDLQTEMMTYYNKPSVKKNDDAAFSKGLAYHLKSWIQWKVFLLIITVGFYSVYYLIKYRNQTSRNIFSNLNRVIKNRKTLLAAPSDAKKTDEKDSKSKDSYTEITEASQDSEHSLKNEETESSKKAEKSLKSKKEPEEKPEPAKKEPSTLAKSDNNTIRFPENIRLCFRLQNGHFVIQGFDNKVSVIDEKGLHVKNLDTTINAIKVPSEMTVFAQLEDGSIVGAGEALHSKNGVIFIWKDEVTAGIELEDTSSIYSLDTFDNQIICSTGYNGAKNTFVISLQMQDGAIQHHQKIASSSIGLVSFIGESHQFAYIDQEGEAPKRHTKEFSSNGELLNQGTLELRTEPEDYEVGMDLVKMPRQNHIMRISKNNTLTASDKIVTIWDDHMTPCNNWKLDNSITHIACSPNKTHFALSDETGNIFLLSTDLNPNEKPAKFFSVDPIQQLFLSDEGKICVAVGVRVEHNIGSIPISELKFYIENEWQAQPDTSSLTL